MRNFRSLISNKQTNKKEFIYGYPLEPEQQTEQIKFYELKTGKTHNVQTTTIEESINLADKNSKEIYVGDICIYKTGKNSYEIGIIKFIQQELKYKLVTQTGELSIDHRSKGTGYEINFNLEIIDQQNIKNLIKNKESQELFITKYTKSMQNKEKSLTLSELLTP